MISSSFKKRIIMRPARLTNYECPPTTIRIIFRFSTIKRQNCHNRLRRQNFVLFVGSGGYDSS